MLRKIFMGLGLSMFVLALPLMGWSQSGQGVQPTPTSLQVSAFLSKTAYNIGEPLDLQITLSADAFVYVFKIDANGDVVQQFPNRFSANENFLTAGAHTLPNSNAFDLLVDGPAGSTLLQVIASTQPVDFGTNDFDQAFPELGDSATFQQSAQDAITDVLANSLVNTTVTAYTVIQPVSNLNIFPSAALNYSPSSPFSGQTIAFDASGSIDPDGQIVLYEWDFTGDGVFDAVGKQVNTVFLDGTFTISLRVTDNAGASTTRTKTIVVQPAALNLPPVPSFSVSTSQPIVGDPVLFDASASVDPDGTIVQYQWDFQSDGQIDLHGERVITRFNTSGTFLVTLTVVDDTGLTATTVQTITVFSGGAGQAPLASFTISPSSPAVNEVVTLNASGSTAFGGAVLTQYQWDFQSDGVIDAFGQQVTVRFTTPGTARITLTVTDSNGLSASTTQTIFVSGSANQAPQALFTVSPSTIAVGQTVTFDATSSFDPDGFIVEYRWDFESDGNLDLVSIGPRVATRFNFAGTFRASLTVVDNNGLTATSDQFIQVGSVIQPPQASFSFSPTVVSVGQTVTFDATGSFDSDGFITEYRWDFQSDGFIDRTGSVVTFLFTSAGSFNVTLTVVDNDGLSASTTQTIQVGQGPRPPTASFTISPATIFVGQTVTFDGSGSFDPDGFISEYRWDLNGDGITDATGVRVNATYNSAGTGVVTLTVVDNDGLTATSQQTIQVNTPLQPPVADFTFSPSDPIAGQLITVDASISSDPDGFIVEYRWQFDSNSFNTGVQSSVTYSTPRTAEIILTVVDNDGLTDTITKSIVIRQAQPPSASFTMTPNPALVGQTVQFDGSASSDSDGSIVEYRWDFDSDGFTDATGAQTAAVFNSAGSTQVTLTVVDDDGFEDSDQQTLTIGTGMLPPTASFTMSSSSINIGDSVTLDASASNDPDGTIVDYRWDFNNDGTVDDIGITVAPTFNTAGTFTIRLTVVDDDGLEGTATQTLTVIDPNAVPDPPGPIPAGQAGVYVLGDSNSFRIVVVGDPAWGESRSFVIALTANTNFGQTSHRVVGEGSGTINSTGARLEGSVGNGWVEFTIQPLSVLTRLTVFPRFNIDGQGDNELIRGNVVVGDQLFVSNQTPFSIVADPSGSTSILPFAGKTLFSCSESLQNCAQLN